MSNSRKPAFKWIGLGGVNQAIQEIKDLVNAAQKELQINNSQGGVPSLKASVKSNESNFKSMNSMEWLNKRQRSVMAPGAPSKPKGKANNKVSADKETSPPKASPLRLKRSASFIGVSPAKGSLIVEQQKRVWAQQQKMQLFGKAPKRSANFNNSGLDNGEPKHSEGDAFETGSVKQRVDLKGRWNLMDEELRSVASQFKKFSVNEQEKLSDIVSSTENDGKQGMDVDLQIAGKKRSRQAADVTDSIVTDSDMQDLADEEYSSMRPSGAGFDFMNQSSTVIKLNKQEEEDLIRELEN